MHDPLADAVSHAQAAVWAWLQSSEHTPEADQLCDAVIALCDAVITHTPTPTPPKPAIALPTPPMLYVISTN